MKPFGKRVIVEVTNKVETIGSLQFEDTEKKQQQREGIIYKSNTPKLKKGDKVLYRAYVDYTVMVEGKELASVEEDDILAII